MTVTLETAKIEQLFRKAVQDDVAPGFQYAVFNKDKLLLSDAVGLDKIPSEADPTGVPLLPQTPLFFVSCGKIMHSIATLIVLERGLAHNGMTLDDLDNHDKLVEILPEFGQNSKSMAGKIIVGFEPHLGSDGMKIPILRDPKNKVTLRHIFTHTLSHPWHVSYFDRLFWVIYAVYCNSH